MNLIYFIPEGETERRVMRVLYEKDILSKSAQLKDDVLEEGGYERVIKLLKSLPGEEGILKAIEWSHPASHRGSKGPARVLLVFDQENASTPEKRAKKIGKDLNLSFNPIIDECKNLFEYKSKKINVILHISSINNKWNMFEGYILEILSGKDRSCIIRKMMRSNIHPSQVEQLINECNELMERRQFHWIDAKARLYAYMAALKFRSSHVWFAREVVKAAIECKLHQELRRVFDCLIKAWERLCRP